MWHNQNITFFTHSQVVKMGIRKCNIYNNNNIIIQPEAVRYSNDRSQQSGL